jgi:hypothetical protein
MNPFTDEYLNHEINAMDFPAEGAEVGDAKFLIRELPFGRINDYLAVNFRAEPLSIPTYIRDKTLWMSLTPMEAQSMAVPLHRAQYHDTVAIGGLGLGYFPLRLAQFVEEGSALVEKIDVYEQNEDCIELFHKLHGDKSAIKHINFIPGDIRENLAGKVYDFAFIDIYEGAGEEEMADDIEGFLGANTIGEYRYWGQELMLGTCSEAFVIDNKRRLMELGIFTLADSLFYEQFGETDGSGMRSPFQDESYAEDIVTRHIEMMEAQL